MKKTASMSRAINTFQGELFPDAVIFQIVESQTECDGRTALLRGLDFALTDSATCPTKMERQRKGTHDRKPIALSVPGLPGR